MEITIKAIHMKKYKLILSLVIASIFITGCGPKPISVPKENVNINDYKKIKIKMLI